MAAMLRSLFLAAVAAVSILASGCGGGNESSSSKTAPFAGVAQPDQRLMSAPRSMTRASFGNATAPGAASNTTKLQVADTGVTSPHDRLFDWAEGVYSEYFPSHQPTQVGDYEGVSYDFRCYVTTSDNCVGVAKTGTDVGGVYGIGPYVGGQLVRFGHIDGFTCLIEPTDCGPHIMQTHIRNAVTGAILVANANGATGVPAKGTVLELTYTGLLNCAGVDGVRTIDQIVLTVTCRGQTLTFTPGLPGETRWPYASTNTVTAAGVQNLEGYPSPSETVAFGTRSVAAGSGTRVYVANFEATAAGGHDVSVIDAATQAIRPVNLGDTLNSVSPQRLVVDAVAGVVYVGAGGDRFYRVDIETGVSLAPFYPDPTGEFPGYWHTVQGLVIAGQDVCTAMGRQDFTEYVYRNRLLCWNRFTLQPSFRSNSDYLAGRQMVVMEAVAVPERNTFYVLAAEALAYDLIVDTSNANGTLKQEFIPGSTGTVYELDANTKAVVRRFTVGAGPRSAVYDAARKRLIVANSGKTSAGHIELSVIDLETGLVTAKRLGFTGDQRPQSVVLARGQLWVSDYVNAVVAFDLVTFVETRRVQVGAYPVFFTETAGRLYVPLPRVTFGGDKVAVVDLATYSLASLIPVGKAPWYVVGFTPAPQ